MRLDRAASLASLLARPIAATSSLAEGTKGAVDPSCCADTWDQDCVTIAAGMQCGDEFCRAVTCYFQPSCCEVMWDASCNETADDFCPGPCRADLNRNGAVGGEDLATLLNQWGLDELYIADQDYDGIVDGTDLALLLGAWGSNCN
ncbi:MAG: hypothetical protein ACO3QC_06080 [Phycisphaerales bacterium]